MPRTLQLQEIEIKLRVSDASALIALLKNRGARQTVPQTHESNTLYDTPEKRLTRQGRLIRVRIEQPAKNAKRPRASQNPPAILTYKGPAQKPPRPKSAPNTPIRRFKVREELEVTVSSGQQLTTMLAALGLRPIFRYEKFRTTYRLPGIPNVKLEFDETPVGLFLELEGQVASIDRAAKLLGYSRSDYITQTYGDLHIADSRRRGIKPGDMLFP